MKNNGIGTELRPEMEFSCANEKLSLLDGQQKVFKLTCTYTRHRGQHRGPQGGLYFD